MIGMRMKKKEKKMHGHIDMFFFKRFASPTLVMVVV